MKKEINCTYDIPGVEGYIGPVKRFSSLAHGLELSQIPDFEASLWRYVNFAQLVSMLDRNSLFFCRADKLGDPFEGAWSDPALEVLCLGDDGRLEVTGDQMSLYSANKELLMSFDLSGFPECERPEPEILVRAWQEMMLRTKDEARFTLINCWHENSHESEAMWKLYAHQGLAIRTSFGKLIKSFTCRLPDIVARVRYLSYETMVMPFIPSAPFMHKRKSFEHEREVRAVISEHRENASSTQPKQHPVGSQKFGYKAREIDYSTDVCNVGLHYNIDVRQLISEVVVSPYAPTWLVDLTSAVVQRYGFQFPVRLSNLAKKPRWD